jgi:hypothetical protein
VQNLQRGGPLAITRKASVPLKRPVTLLGGGLLMSVCAFFLPTEKFYFCRWINLLKRLSNIE